MTYNHRDIQSALDYTAPHYIGVLTTEARDVIIGLGVQVPEKVIGLLTRARGANPTESLQELARLLSSHVGEDVKVFIRNPS